MRIGLVSISFILFFLGILKSTATALAEREGRGAFVLVGSGKGMDAQTFGGFVGCFKRCESLRKGVIAILKGILQAMILFLPPSELLRGSSQGCQVLSSPPLRCLYTCHLRMFCCNSVFLC